VFPDGGHNVVLSADFYDFATNLDQNVTVTLNSEKGTESVAMGLRGAHCYAARVNGFAAKTNWVPFKRGQLPVVGWHRFKATISVSNVVFALDLGADGTEERRITVPLDAPAPTFTQLRFGGYAKAPIPGGTVLVDNLRLELVSIPITVASAQTEPVATNAAPPPAEPIVINASSGLVEAPQPRSSTTQALVTVAPPPTNSMGTTAGLNADSPRAEPMQIRAILPWAFWWISVALVLLTLVMLFMLVALRRSAGLTPRLANGEGPRMLGDGTMINATDETGSWRERALQAESVVAKQSKILTSKVGPDLVEFAKESLVQGLYSQRSDLIEAQARAKQTLAELESRLADLHLPRQERVRAYEERIAELEKQLGSRDDEMRELTRATLVLVRQKLEQTKHAQGTRLN
jgi:hypothetical protein